MVSACGERFVRGWCFFVEGAVSLWDRPWLIQGVNREIGVWVFAFGGVSGVCVCALVCMLRCIVAGFGWYSRWVVEDGFWGKVSACAGGAAIGRIEVLRATLLGGGGWYSLTLGSILVLGDRRCDLAVKSNLRG